MFGGLGDFERCPGGKFVPNRPPATRITSKSGEGLFQTEEAFHVSTEFGNEALRSRSEGDLLGRCFARSLKFELHEFLREDDFAFV
jgi:hypothetical protein